MRKNKTAPARAVLPATCSIVNSCDENDYTTAQSPRQPSQTIPVQCASLNLIPKINDLA